jgi:hypothetical protein
MILELGKFPIAPMAVTQKPLVSGSFAAKVLQSLWSKLDTGYGRRVGRGQKAESGQLSAVSYQLLVVSCQWSVVNLPELRKLVRGLLFILPPSAFILLPSSLLLSPPCSKCNIPHMQRCTISGSQTTSRDGKRYKTSTKRAMLVGRGD